MATITGSGSITASNATLGGTGEVEKTGTGALVANNATLAGVSEREVTGLGSVTAHAATMSGAAVNGPSGAPEIPFNQTVAGVAGTALIVFNQVVGEAGVVSLPFSQSVVVVSGAPSIPFNQIIGEVGTVSLPFDQRVTDIANLNTTTIYWQPTVTLSGVDISTSLVGTIRVEAEESTARICEFEMVPPSGAITLTDWVGAAVTVDFNQTDSDGTITQTWRRFTGVVDLPDYDPITGIVSFRCTDQLQEIIENMSASLIDSSLSSSYWSSEVFNEDDNGWDRAQDRLTTVPYSFELNESRMPRYTPWKAKLAADVTYTASEIDDDSLRISLATRRDLHNLTELTINYRYEKLYHREQTFSWRYPYAFCTYINDPTTIPNTAMVKSALFATGWLVDSISFTPLPKTQNIYLCWLGTGRFRHWINRQPLVTGFVANMVKRWTQTVTESYTISLRADGSITTHGEIPRKTTVSISTDYDYESFENEGGDDPRQGDNDGDVVNYAPDSVDRGLMEGWNNAYPPPSGATIDSSGDYILDKDDRTNSDNAMETIIAREKTSILAAHRQNRVSFNTDLAPWVGLEMTARVNTTRVDAIGKVAHIIESMNIETGEATSSLTLAVSRGGGSVDSAIAAPTPPATTASTTTLSRTILGTHIGGRDGVDQYSDNMDGYTGNYEPQTPGAEVYPVRLKIDIDAIESDRRDAQTPTSISSLNVQIPNDSLTITH